MMRPMILVWWLQLGVYFVQGQTFWNCNGATPVVKIGTRGSTMRTYKAASKTIADFPISQCSPLACRRFISGASQMWTQTTQAKCASPPPSGCYAHTTTEALPIIANQGLNKCENLANVALRSGSLVKPTATGACSCNVYGISIWQYADSSLFSTNTKCSNFNQCSVSNGWCASGTTCTDVGGDEGYRTCGGCPSGTSGNGDGVSVCPSCAVGKYSVYSSSDPTTSCIACSPTCGAGQGATDPCTAVQRTKDRVCTACPAGTYNDGTFLFCRACSTTCPQAQGLSAGCTATSRKIDRTCSACAAGKFQLGNSLTCSSCAKCLPGNGVLVNCTTSNDRVCSPCMNDTFSPGGEDSCHNCTVCPTGSRQVVACTSSADTGCVWDLVGNCTSGVSAIAGLGILGTIACNATPNVPPTPSNGPPAISVVIEIVVHDENGAEVPISGLQTGQYIEFFLPFTPEALAQQEDSCGLNDRHRDLGCAWYDPAAQQFVSSGCVKAFINATGVMCSCTHLTEFALIMQMPGICKHELAPQEFFLMALYVLIFFAAVYQAVRIALLPMAISRGTVILRNEHLLVALVALLRGIQIGLKGSVSAPVLAILAGVPHTVELGMYSFVVFTWVGGVMMEGTVNPFAKLKYPFAATVTFFAMLTIGVPIAIACLSNVEAQMTTARYGSYCMGAVIYLVMGFVLYFGLRLRNKLFSLRKANTTGGSSTLALKILTLTLITSFLFCVIATLWIVSVSDDVIVDDLLFPILQFLYHFADAMLLVLLLVMFSKAVSLLVKKGTAVEVGSSSLQLSKKNSSYTS